MNSDRCPTCKAKKHLLPMPLRTKEPYTGERLFQSRDISAAEHPLFGMQRNPDHLTAQAGIPFPAEIFDFCKLRHGLRYDPVSCAPVYYELAACLRMWLSACSYLALNPNIVHFGHYLRGPPLREQSEFLLKIDRIIFH